MSVAAYSDGYSKIYYDGKYYFVDTGGDRVLG